MINKPFAESCVQNQEVILSVIKQWFTKPNSNVFEIGSGTGQHACYFASALTHLFWQPSDTTENIAGINAWLADAQLNNIHPPLVLNVTQANWGIDAVNYVFSANTVHIMGWNAVVAMFNGIRGILKPGGIFCLYGPFNYNRQYTSDSNARFDQWLKDRDPQSGIRDFEAVCELAEMPSLQPPMTLIKDHEMPANNRILVFQSQHIQ